MASELEKLLGEDKKDVTPPSEEKPKEEKKPEEKKPQEKNPEVEQKAEQLANLNKAITEANDTLKNLRKSIKESKGEETEELPQIDFKDPSAKAWDKHIKDAVGPAQKELEKAKEERRLFTLRQFLTDKPALAKDPEKLKAMMETYERIKKSTELTSEGILMDLERAYVAENAEELVSAMREGRIEAAKKDAAHSEAGISRGSTTYSKEESPKKNYTEEEKDIVREWEKHGAPKVD